MSKQPGRLKKEWKKVTGGLVGLALVVDILGNAATGGSLDETISSRAGRAVRDGGSTVGVYIATALCYVLDAIDEGHCADAADNKGG